MIRAALREVFAGTRYRWLALASFAAFLAVYLLTLPATFTGGHVGPAALRYLTTQLLLWSLVMAALMGLLVPFTVYLVRRGQKAHSGAAAGGLALGLVTPLLCCTPAIPLVFSVAAAAVPAAGAGAGGLVQGFLATHEWLFFGVASALMALALTLDVREVVRGACCRI